ncbi:MAG: GNAT family N-acetyltransferase [Candidatus Cloacimonetes bacterium]|nr:GNAT family N-acetyltransferase [Candidatus Cloacimonadota bacterium]
MTIAFNVNRLIETELNFAKRFTNVTPKPYGLIYWNEANKESHDSNHAIITDFVGVEASLKDIVNFYKAKGITPRLYPSLKDKELDILSQPLENHGFILNHHPNKYYLHERESSITPAAGVHIERIRQMTTQLRDYIIANQQGEHTIKVVQRHLSHPNYHLLGAFVADELVAVASVNIFAGYSRVDDVHTHISYRGKGYSSALIHYLVSYHKRQSENHLYLYSSMPEAIRVYEKAGFIQIPHEFRFWTAYKNL